MGCDIHAHIEVKINGEWHHWCSPYIQRNYRLFARLAGVRTDSPEEDQKYPTKPLPEDMTVPTKVDWERGLGDWHSESWIDGREVEEVDTWIHEQNLHRDAHSIFGYLFGDGYDVKRYPNDYPKGVEDCRMIFWFDN